MDRVFIQTKEFEDQLSALSFPPELLIDIEQEILKDLKKRVSFRDMISGTGGFTKLRVPFKLQNMGKSGAARVIYFDCMKAKRTFLIMIYAKSDIENISVGGKQVLKKIGMELRKWQPRKKK